MRDASAVTNAAFAPILAANGGGAIVNVLSVVSWISMPTTGAYCATKAAALSGPAAVTTGAPRLVADPAAVESGFVASAGLVVDEASTDRVRGHIDIDDSHHTPWGIVHGGVYSTAVESAGPDRRTGRRRALRRAGSPARLRTGRHE